MQLNETKNVILQNESFQIKVTNSYIWFWFDARRTIWVYRHLLTYYPSPIHSNVQTIILEYLKKVNIMKFSLQIWVDLIHPKCGTWIPAFTQQVIPNVMERFEVTMETNYKWNRANALAFNCIISIRRK